MNRFGWTVSEQHKEAVLRYDILLIDVTTGDAVQCSVSGLCFVFVFRLHIVSILH